MAQSGIGAVGASPEAVTAGRSAATHTKGHALAPPASPTRLQLYLVLAFGVVCIGLSAIFTVWSGVSGTVSAFYRVVIAAAVLAIPFGQRVIRGQVALDRRVWLLAGGAGVFFAADLALWNTSLFLTPAANATLLGNDAPIVVGIGALILFRERLRPLYWIGLAVALSGMAIVAGRDVFAHSSLGSGDLLALLAGCCYAGYLLSTQRIRVRMDTLSSLLIPATVGGALLLAFNVATQRLMWGFSAHIWLSLVALALISQVAGWLAINYALGHMPASLVSVTLLAQPVLTALFAVPMLGEPLTGSQILGGTVALAGIYLVNRPGAHAAVDAVPSPVARLSPDEGS